MTFLRWGGLPALGAGLLVLACGGDGGGGTGPCTPGAATQLVKTGGDAQSWYFDNPLPSALNVTARDANNCAVPGVVVNWAVASGGGAVSPTQSTTGTSGVAATADSIGSTSPQTVTATFSGLATPVTFTATASGAPTALGVSVRSEEHTSELQSRFDIVCRLLLEKKKNKKENQMKQHIKNNRLSTLHYIP